MGFFNKNKKKEVEEVETLPNLPDLPPVPQPIEMQQEEYALPYYPNSNMGQVMNQNAIKEAVISQPEYDAQMQQPMMPLQNNPQFENRMMKPKVIESTDWSNPQMPLQPSINPNIQIKKQEPIYIKLDKFENTISTFNEIKIRVSEIESLLRTIKGIKQREEEELNQWENELEIIKARLDQINHEMFKGI